jgi:hypothetical protein
MQQDVPSPDSLRTHFLSPIPVSGKTPAGPIRNRGTRLVRSFRRLETEPENFCARVIRAFSTKKLQGDGVKITKNPASIGLKVFGYHAGIDLPRKPETLQDGIIAGAEKFLEIKRDGAKVSNRRMHTANA